MLSKPASCWGLRGLCSGLSQLLVVASSPQASFTGTCPPPPRPLMPEGSFQTADLVLRVSYWYFGAHSLQASELPKTLISPVTDTPSVSRLIPRSCLLSALCLRESSAGRFQKAQWPHTSHSLPSCGGLGCPLAYPT